MGEIRLKALVISIIGLLFCSREALAGGGFYRNDGFMMNGEWVPPTAIEDDPTDQGKAVRAKLAQAPNLSLVSDIDISVQLYPVVGTGKNKHVDFEGKPKDGGKLCDTERQTRGRFLICLQQRIQSYGSETSSARTLLNAALERFNSAAKNAGAPTVGITGIWNDAKLTEASWNKRLDASIGNLAATCKGDSSCLAEARLVHAMMKQFIAKYDIYTHASVMQDRIWRDSAEPAPKNGPNPLPSSDLVILLEKPDKKKSQSKDTPSGGSGGNAGFGNGHGAGSGSGNGKGSSKSVPTSNGSGGGGSPKTGPSGVPSGTPSGAPGSLGADPSGQPGSPTRQLNAEQKAEAQKAADQAVRAALADFSKSNGQGGKGQGSGNGGTPGGISDAERRVRSPTDPLVDLSFFGLGASRYPCPDFVGALNCLPSSGKWAPGAKTSSSGTPLSKEEISASYSTLKPILFQLLAEHAVKVMGESYVTTLAATNPDSFTTTAGLKARVKDFMTAASCLSPSAKTDLQKSLDKIQLPEKGKLDELKATMRIRRELLGVDLHSVSTKLAAAIQTKGNLAPRFENGGNCGFFAMRLNQNAGAIGVNDECNSRFVDLQQARATEQEALANYPFLSITIPEEDGTPVWKLIANANDPSGAKALQYYDSVIGQTSAAALKRVKDICDNPQKEGKAAMLNPVISRSFFGEEDNKGAAWVFCAAYAENARNDELIKIAKTGFMIATVAVTGGIAGVVMGAGVVGLAVYDNYSKYEELQRDKNDYLAGAGNVDAYLAARDGLNHFWRNASVEVGLASLALVPGIGMVRSWMKARQLAKIGAVAELPAETASKLLSWYRGRAISMLGKDAAELSNAELIMLAKAESEGANISLLRKATGCLL